MIELLFYLIGSNFKSILLKKFFLIGNLNRFNINKAKKGFKESKFGNAIDFYFNLFFVFRIKIYNLGLAIRIRNPFFNSGFQNSIW